MQHEPATSADPVNEQAVWRTIHLKGRSGGGRFERVATQPLAEAMSTAGLDNDDARQPSTRMRAAQRSWREGWAGAGVSGLPAHAEPRSAPHPPPIPPQHAVRRWRAPPARPSAARSACAGSSSARPCRRGPRTRALGASGSLPVRRALLVVGKREEGGRGTEKETETETGSEGQRERQREGDRGRETHTEGEREMCLRVVHGWLVERLGGARCTRGGRHGGALATTWWRQRKVCARVRCAVDGCVLGGHARLVSRMPRAHAHEEHGRGTKGAGAQETTHCACVIPFRFADASSGAAASASASPAPAESPPMPIPPKVNLIFRFLCVYVCVWCWWEEEWGGTTASSGVSRPRQNPAAVPVPRNGVPVRVLLRCCERTSAVPGRGSSWAARRGDGVAGLTAQGAARRRGRCGRIFCVSSSSSSSSSRFCARASESESASAPPHRRPRRRGSPWLQPLVLRTHSTPPLDLIPNAIQIQVLPNQPTSQRQRRGASVRRLSSSARPACACYTPSCSAAVLGEGRYRAATKVSSRAGYGSERYAVIPQNVFFLGGRFEPVRGVGSARCVPLDIRTAAPPLGTTAPCSCLQWL